MWLCTKHGFYSVVLKAKDEVHVRARSRGDLINFKRLTGLRSKIHQTEPADYRFRLVLTGAQWRKFGPRLLADLDYSNFKGVIAQTPDQREKLSIYSAFHHDLERWQQRNEPTSGLLVLPDMEA